MVPDGRSLEEEPGGVDNGGKVEDGAGRVEDGGAGAISETRTDPQDLNHGASKASVPEVG